MRIHCKYTGIKGFLTVYNDVLRYRYMLTEKAKFKAKVLIFWEKHSLEATFDAFPAKRSALFNWKKQWVENGKRVEALNEKSRAPRTRRNLRCPRPRTVANLIQDLGGLRIFPQKVSHFGKMKKFVSAKFVL